MGINESQFVASNKIHWRSRKKLYRFKTLDECFSTGSEENHTVMLCTLGIKFRRDLSGCLERREERNRK